MTLTASRPAQAMRGGAVFLVLALAWRVPAIEHEFTAALASVAAVRPLAAAAQAMIRQTTASASVAAATSAAIEPPLLPLLRQSAVARRKSLPAPPAVIGPPFLAKEDDATVSRGSPDIPMARTSAAPPAGAFDLATAAYARLVVGDRRGAVRLFDAALAIGDPRSAPWRAQRDALTRRWSASAYSVVRASGSPGAARTPVLGGGQSGGGIAFLPDPLAGRPLALTLRGSIAHDDGGRTAFAAVGVQWRPLPGVTLAAERLIGVGPAAHDDWTARVAVGDDRRLGRLRLATYAEGGIIGSAGYAAGQARVGPEVNIRGIALVPGVGGWSSIQRDHGHTVDRLDLGPGVAARAGPLAVAIDYRVRAAGNATPGSGPVVTLSAAF